MRGAPALAARTTNICLLQSFTFHGPSMDHEKLFWGKLEIFKEARSALASSKTNIEKCAST